MYFIIGKKLDIKRYINEICILKDVGGLICKAAKPQTISTTYYCTSNNGAVVVRPTMYRLCKM